MKIREHYQTRSNRDARYHDLKRRESVSNLRRSSSRGSLLHPQYVEDFQGPEKQDTGLGNTVYKTYFKVLYTVECDISG